MVALVSWKKATGVNDYQILFAENKSFTKDKKSYYVNSKTTKKQCNTLSAGKTYYVKVRAYKTVSNKKYYSSYSTIKKITVK